MLIVLSEFALRVYILEELGSVPPFLVGLNKDGIWLNLLNEFLGPLSEHSGLIAGVYKEYLLIIKSLGEMDKS